MIEDLTPILRAAWMGDEHIPAGSIAKAASSAAESLKEPQVPDLVRLAFGDARPDSSALVLASFNGDVGIVEDGQYLRQQLLAVAVLLALLEDSAGAHVDLAALIVKAFVFGGREPGHPRLVSASEKHLAWSRNDGAKSPARPKVAGQSTALKTALEQLTTADWNVYRTAIVEVSNEVTRVRQALARQAAWVEQRDPRVNEQLELLWWITSGISATTRQPLSEVPSVAAPIIAGLDVAALAPRSPGPPSSLGLLRFAIALVNLRSEEVVSLGASKEALDAISGSLVPAPNVDDADLFPVFAFLTGISEQPSAKQAPALALAEESLVESYLYKTFGASGDND